VTYGEGSILAVAIYFINNSKGLAPSPVYKESMYTGSGHGVDMESMYTEVGVYLLLVNTWRLPGLYMESTWSLQGVTITVFSINSVHGLPVQFY
jgi:hypothetical protein